MSTCHKALERAGVDPKQVAEIGIANQRETTVVWDKSTGKLIYNAIVWQDRCTAEYCSALRDAGQEPMITEQTGLLVAPYISATKLKWVLDTVEGARARATNDELLFGTIDCFLIWRITGETVHATDAIIAARTMLYDIRNGHWSADICDLLDIPMQMLPEENESAADFCTNKTDIFGGEIRICGVAGDQQAATLGKRAFSPGC